MRSGEAVCESFLQFIVPLNAAWHDMRRKLLAMTKLMHVKDPDGVKPIAAY